VAVFADAPQKLEHSKLIGVSRITELPPLPPNMKANTEVQPLFTPVPIFRVLSDEQMARGTVANTGAATAIVYRNSHDNGFGNFNKSTQGNFVGNLLHLGNGFPMTGGEIKGYDLLVYDSSLDPSGWFGNQSQQRPARSRCGTVTPWGSSIPASAIRRSRSPEPPAPLVVWTVAGPAATVARSTAMPTPFRTPAMAVSWMVSPVWTIRTVVAVLPFPAMTFRNAPVCIVWCATSIRR
jgi:hypothetical protein